MKPLTIDLRLGLALLLLLCDTGQPAVTAASTPPPPDDAGSPVTAPGGALAGAQVDAQAGVPGGPGYVSLTSLAFQPWSSIYTWQHEGVSLYSTYTITAAYFDAVIQLPNRATVTRLVGYFKSADATKTGTVYLWQCPLGTEYCNEMASVTPAANTGYTHTIDTTIVTPVVDNAAYSYQLEVKLPTTSRFEFLGARVDYTYDVSLPYVKK